MKLALGLFLLAAMQNAVTQTTFHGNNARSGVYASPGPTKLNGLKWTFKTGGPIVSSAAVADGFSTSAASMASCTRLIRKLEKRNGNINPACRSPPHQRLTAERFISFPPRVPSKQLTPPQASPNGCLQRSSSENSRPKTFMGFSPQPRQFPMPGTFLSLPLPLLMAGLLRKRRWQRLRCRCPNRHLAVEGRHEGRRACLTSRSRQYGVYRKLG
jgi:hypothetical protein